MTVTDAFHETFGRSPAITGTAPGRVNLIGEHTDYNGGAVLPAALEQRIEIALAPRDTATTRIASSRFGDVIERPVGDPKRGNWTDYAMGALFKAEQLGWLSGGVDLQIESKIPDGAGVSSSAALITAILRAVASLASIDISPVALAKHARAVENDYIGMPCGIMDQMAVGLCEHGKALALDTSDLSYQVLDIPADWRFVVIHSGIRRELADGRYKQRFEECHAARMALRTEHLCKLTPDQRAAVGNLPENLQKRARHVVSEHERTRAAGAAMRDSDFERFGQLMNDSHHSYARDFEASTPGIDALVEEAVAQGAVGARLTGGGFGGCIVALVRSDQADAWCKSLLSRHPKAWRV